MKSAKTILKTVLPFPAFLAIRKTCGLFKSLPYLGSRYTCPLCHGHFSRLLSMGRDIPVLRQYQIAGGYREHSKCPRCSSNERERLIFLYLLDKHPYLFEQPIKMLHVAPDVNLRSYFHKFNNIDYLCVDLYEPGVDEKMDITHISKENDRYDVIICSHVLEHIPDDRKALRELYRVLKTGGFAILQVPISWIIATTIEDPSVTDPAERLQRFGQEDHVRIYGPDYVDRLKESGFDVEILDYFSKLDPDTAANYGLMPEEKLFICSKPAE